MLSNHKQLYTTSLISPGTGCICHVQGIGLPPGNEVAQPSHMICICPKHQSPHLKHYPWRLFHPPQPGSFRGLISVSYPAGIISISNVTPISELCGKPGIFPKSISHKVNRAKPKKNTFKLPHQNFHLIWTSLQSDHHHYESHLQSSLFVVKQLATL